jgi:hypothetical protein
MHGRRTLEIELGDRHRPHRAPAHARRARTRGGREPEGESRRPQGSRRQNQGCISSFLYLLHALIPPRLSQALRGGQAASIQGPVEVYVCAPPDSTSAVLNIQEAYQTEIDSLTKRAKTAESAFLSVYKVIAEAPDPYPLLEAALVRVLDEPQTLRSSGL